MKTGRHGFTLIEVAIFLAITGALFISVTIGVQNSISQQRNNDAVQNFAEYLRNTYSEVTNVQNTRAGNSEFAIYGKLITFGENADVNDPNSDRKPNDIYSYDVVGSVKGDSKDTVLKTLNAYGVDVVMLEGNELKLAGIVQSYTPKWGAQIEPICNNLNCSYDTYEGALLIVRDPKSGTVFTFVSNDAVPINEQVSTAQGNYSRDSEGIIPTEETNIKKSPYSVLPNYLNQFKIQQVDYCVNPYPGEQSNNRRDVRIQSGARNASGVEIVNDDDSKCVRRET